jgi:hypothetical protein
VPLAREARAGSAGSRPAGATKGEREGRQTFLFFDRKLFEESKKNDLENLIINS